MSTLFEQLLYTTLRIECKDNDGNLTGIGTGFLLSRPVSGDKYKLYLVSNKHILMGTPKILVSFICKENGEPQHQRVHKVEIQGVDQAVKGHPDPEVDIAAIECTGMLVDMIDRIYYKHIPYDLLADFDEPELSIAENVYFVGYPAGRFDTSNNLPLMRIGMIASHPKFDFNGKPQFVIDAQVFPGSSGSPVYIDLTYENFRNGRIVVGERKLKLLGIVAQTMLRNNVLQAVPTSTNYVMQEVMGLGIVLSRQRLKNLWIPYQWNNVIRVVIDENMEHIDRNCLMCSVFYFLN